MSSSITNSTTSIPSSSFNWFHQTRSLTIGIHGWLEHEETFLKVVGSFIDLLHTLAFVIIHYYGHCSSDPMAKRWVDRYQPLLNLGLHTHPFLVALTSVESNVLAYCNVKSLSVQLQALSEEEYTKVHSFKSAKQM